jgi:hypothetical protein
MEQWVLKGELAYKSSMPECENHETHEDTKNQKVPFPPPCGVLP